MMDRIEELKQELLTELQSQCKGYKVRHLSQLLIDNTNSKELTVDAGMMVFLVCGMLSEAYRKKGESKYEGFKKAHKAIVKIVDLSVQAPEAFDCIEDFRDEFMQIKSN
tara:strand:+ start:1255 stop:1581 length:327 start_codon:yes stop_codon:yes gene_type:complete